MSFPAKSYGDLLLPELLKVLHEAYASHQLPDSMNLSFRKPGKDKLYPESFRPISLLNLDVKIMATVLANRLSRVRQLLVHPD